MQRRSPEVNSVVHWYDVGSEVVFSRSWLRLGISGADDDHLWPLAAAILSRESRRTYWCVQEANPTDFNPDSLLTANLKSWVARRRSSPSRGAGILFILSAGALVQEKSIVPDHYHPIIGPFMFALSIDSLTIVKMFIIALTLLWYLRLISFRVYRVSKGVKNAS